MNVQIYSNTKNQEGDVNYNNKFAVTLPESIDGENKTRYIRPLNVSYPQMINNVQEKTCGIRFKHTLFWKSKPTVEPDNLTVETDWIYLEPGRYTLKKLVKKLNNISISFGVHFLILAGGHVGVSVDLEPTYIRRINNNDTPTYQPYLSRTPQDFSYELNKDLKYILGMDKIILHPEVQRLYDDEILIWNGPPPTALGMILAALHHDNGASPAAVGENKMWCFFMVNIVLI
jgi:hypothetical protein